MSAQPKTKSKGMVSWPVDERPRERLFLRGSHALTDAELVAIFLRIGVHGKSAIELGRELLKRFGSVPEIEHYSFTDTGLLEESSFGTLASMPARHR